MEQTFRINEIDAAQLDAERQRVLNLITEHVESDYVFEVGSTAVTGVIGKQDLDFLVRVSAAEFCATRAVLDQHFARNPQQLSTDEYQGYLVKSKLDVAIQLTITHGPHDTFLKFLDLLQNSAELRDSYNQLKRRYDGQPMAEYRDAKQRFIENTLGNL